MSAPTRPTDSKSKLAQLGEWFDLRLSFRESILPPIVHEIPRSSGSWWYVFGSATLLCFVLQIVTGICLALVYVPAADQAQRAFPSLERGFGFGEQLVHAAAFVQSLAAS